MTQPTETDDRLAAALAEIERLRARICELEIAAAMTRGHMGTLEPPPGDDDFSVTHDVAPNAPRE